MDKEEFQKKYDNSILVCCTEDKIKKVFNICDLMDLTASNSKQATAILIGKQTAKSPLFHVEQFLNDFYKEMEEEKKEVKMFEQRMNNAIYKLKQKYGDTYIIKGTDMDTVIQLISELGMNTVQKEGKDTILIEEGDTIPCVRHSARQFITELMSNMIDVLDSFINEEMMVEVKEKKDTEIMINEVESYLTNTLTKPLHKIYNTQRRVYSIGYGYNEKVMIDENDFYVFRKAVYLLYMCNKWVMEDNKKQSKEPTFNKGNKIMYTIKDSNSNTYPVSRLSERVYESKEHKTLFITDEEGTVTGIYKEK
jgi:small nuclear ribonucleoprotein (snRNP)-like protein